ncbi:MAG: molecular chaperone DnaK, partial [Bauldia litoralis]
EDVADIEAKTNALAQASMKLGEAMYQASAAAGDDGEDAGDVGGPGNDDVVDADFEEVNDDDQQKSA